MDAKSARDKLDNAYFQRDDNVKSDKPIIGIFGNAGPNVLLAAAGIELRDIKFLFQSHTRNPNPNIAQFIEPFVDATVQQFLFRLDSGDFQNFHALIFPRDDSAALTAYLYATELVRQKKLAVQPPKLILWNLVHTKSTAAAQFNLADTHRVFAELNTPPPSESRLALALNEEEQRLAALADLMQKNASPTPKISGCDAHIFRNAGRFLSAKSHSEALAILLKHATAPIRSKGPRIGYIGNVHYAHPLFQALEKRGTLVAAAHDQGHFWPTPLGTKPTFKSLINNEAEAGISARSTQPQLFINAHVSPCISAGCEIVALALNNHDDLLGWYLPEIKKRLLDEGIILMDLGFEPDDWTDILNEKWLELPSELKGEAP